MAVQEKLLTADEFWELYAGKPYELIHGRVVPLGGEAVSIPGEAVQIMPVVSVHGWVTISIGAELRQFVRTHDLGGVFGGEAGFRLGPNIVRGADVAFVSREKLEQIDWKKYVPFAPDLAVEIVSQHDTADEVMDKVNLYLKAGTALVWVFYPGVQQVLVHRANRTSQTITRDGFLDGEDVLPGLKIAVAELLPPSSQPASEPPSDS